MHRGAIERRRDQIPTAARKRAFVDTSAWSAYVNRKDPQYAWSVSSWAGFRGTSNFIFDETVSLRRYRLGHDAACVVGGVLTHPDEVDLLRVTNAENVDGCRGVESELTKAKNSP